MIRSTRNWIQNRCSPTWCHLHQTHEEPKGQTAKAYKRPKRQMPSSTSLEEGPTDEGKGYDTKFDVCQGPIIQDFTINCISQQTACIVTKNLLWWHFSLNIKWNNHHLPMMCLQTQLDETKLEQAKPDFTEIWCWQSRYGKIGSCKKWEGCWGMAEEEFYCHFRVWSTERI